MKADIEIVKETMIHHQIDEPKAQEIIDDLKKVIEEELAARAPAVKKQYGVIVSDPLGHIPPNSVFTGWVFQMEEEDNVADGLRRVHTTVFDFNQTKKGQRTPIRTVGGAMEIISGTLFKENGIIPKTKEPVCVLVTDNKIGHDPGMLPLDE